MIPSYDETTIKTAPLNVDWELDFYSRSSTHINGKKKWELIICSTPLSSDSTAKPRFRWEMPCPTNSVNSLWLKEALGQALTSARKQGFVSPRRIRSWRSSMRTMVQRAAEYFDVEFVPSRRCYTLTEWMKERETHIYSFLNYSAKNEIIGSTYNELPAIPLPTAVRGDSWSWASLPIDVLCNTHRWDISFASLLSPPTTVNKNILVPGICLLSNERALAIAAWIEGLEPVKLKIFDNQLVLEAGLEDKWLLTDLSDEEAAIAKVAFNESSVNAFGLQFLAVQKDISHFDGLWMMRDC
ncbi:MAG TPA: Tab2/Atab2 family RNA-binding protein [Prochlorococcaceae cyanobacterium AMR_MDS_5431]|nr:Tab2/Atab2 family RNA-binding protein [Prochlorococcaceae cyanobacterium AMR_MDS_5431]